MVRLSDLHPEEAENLLNWPPCEIEPGEWITPKPLAESTIALITTAGLHRRDDPPFGPGAVDYRLIPGDVDFGELVCSHLSVNWDRSALEQDPNVVLPLERLRELAEAGEIGGVARWHYSFMGGVPKPEKLEPHGREVGRLLKRDGVDAVVLAPV
ncbi:MAG: D-proline reductase (dithiol) PrdB [Chloroflexi bacterium]|jgi:D-proline reductase (dithiol) PrdB|nr:MAG: D-proline reductase (dithiol) PrdB [Chloroflexota bacterium]